MKKLIVAFLVVVSFVSFANAQHIGPATPAVNISGGVASPNVGIGYGYIKSEWEVDDINLGDVEINFGGLEFDLGDIEPILNSIDVSVGDIELNQNQVYVHIGAVFGDESTPNYEVFARIGVADLEADDGDFDGDAEMIYAVGMRNEFYQGQVFGIGGVLQASYIDSFDDSTTLSVDGETFKAKASVESMYDAELGLPIQAKINNGILYFGPLVYLSGADMDFKVSNDIASISFDTEIEEDRNFGAFGGLAWRTENLSFEVEGKYRSDFTVGGLFSFVF